MSEEKKRMETPGGAPAPNDKSAEELVQQIPVPANQTDTPLASEAAEPKLSVPDEEELEAWNQQVRRRMRQKSRRSFLGLGAGAAGAFGAFRWLTTRREIDEIPWPFRKVLETNEQLARDYFRTRRLAPTFSSDRIGEDRANGDYGLDDDLDVESWRLKVQGPGAQGQAAELRLEEIQKLPRFEMTTEFKCIEGWSVVVQWAGARFTDFMRAFPPKMMDGSPLSPDQPEDLPPYVSMETPDGEYYVGLEIESMLHPQTMLCYERNGAPLTPDHGAPLRLVIPVKYGVKNLKRIGTIRYSSLRPADYWAERGYDWYIGL